MTQPTQRPHESDQVVLTPPDFLTAVQARFGPIDVDVAASSSNVCRTWFGPGSPIAQDGLAVAWPRDAVVWCNPPFRDCAAWTRKASAEVSRGVFSLVLTPLALETRWFEAIEQDCCALVLRPRLRFVGHDHDYPKGLMLLVYGLWGELEPGTIRPWRWK